MDPASLSLGVASLAIQVFQAVKQGYAYFEDAANMPEDCGRLKLRLRIEYVRLLDWCDVAGLSNEADHEMYNEKLKVNRPLIMALLSEMGSSLQKLAGYTRKYSELKWEDVAIQQSKDSLPSTDNSQAAHTKPDAGTKVHVTFDSTSSQDDADRESQPPANSRQSVGEIDFEGYAIAFQAPLNPKTQRKYPRGLNHLINVSKGAKDIVKQPRRITWSLSVRERFETDLRRLKELTDYLHETLGDNKMQALLEATQESWMALLQLTTEIKDMKELLIVAEGLKPTARNVSDSSSVFSQASTLVEDRFDVRADVFAFSSTPAGQHVTLFEKLARFNITHEEIYSSQDTSGHGQLKVDEDPTFQIELYDEKDFGSRSLARYKGSDVWVEWKKYKEIMEPDPDGPISRKSISPEVVRRVRQLVALLQTKDKPEELRVPHCVGYCQRSENQSFGFVYELPHPGSNLGSKPSSLLELFDGQTASLQSRIRAAQDISTCMFYFHAVNWLHKALRSASIIFPAGANVPDLSRPYISGFEYARPDQRNMTATSPPSDPAWAVYCHPDYQGPKQQFGFRKTFDLYSLGIILIEIAYWRPAEEIFGIGKPKKTFSTSLVPPTSPSAKADAPAADRQEGINGSLREHGVEDAQDVRARLLKDEPELLEGVRTAMGERYHSAVGTCIDGLQSFNLPADANQNDPNVKAVMQQAYLRLVVDVLRSIAV